MVGPFNGPASDRFLGIYINDHRAATAAGIALAKRSQRQNEGTPFGELLAALVPELEEDAATLNRVADRAKACEALPEDPVGLVGRITTPSEKAPNQAVRFLSFSSDLIDFARAAPEVDMSEVTQLQEQMLTTLNRMSR